MLSHIQPPQPEDVAAAVDRLPTIRAIAALLLGYEWDGSQPTPDDAEFRAFAEDTIRDAAAALLFVEQLESHPTLRDDVGYRAVALTVAAAARLSGMSLLDSLNLTARAHGYRLAEDVPAPCEGEPLMLTLLPLDPPPVH